ncbi:MAG: ATP-grasp domain-containing protein [Microcystaceae cyanobacterium]
MTSTAQFSYFEGNSFSDLFASDIQDASYGFILNYPATASWAVYPNTQKYYIQDGSNEATKTSYDRICQKEPWKNLAVLGEEIAGLAICSPRNLLLDYWRETFGFTYQNLDVLQRSVYLDYLNQTDQYNKVITLFPFDRLNPEKHAVNPDSHYALLSKTCLADIGIETPSYQIHDLTKINLEEVKLPEAFPYLIKTTHGLSGEGTYIIKEKSDLDYCWRELQNYLEIKLIREIIVSDFVKDTIQNYCVQFYVSKSGKITLIGATSQLVNEFGQFLGGIIHYKETDMSRFFSEIQTISNYAHQNGYFGVIGADILEDQQGQLHVIDINFRVNGSTPLCLQRHTLLKLGKEVAKYSGDYQMQGTLDHVLKTLKVELQQKDFMILSALEKVNYGKIYCDIYGIISGETVEKMQETEQKLQQKGLQSN